MNVEVFCFDAVAPVRERGLKYAYNEQPIDGNVRRSREGAWIEMFLATGKGIPSSSRSREGAWIEISLCVC